MDDVLGMIRHAYGTNNSPKQRGQNTVARESLKILTSGFIRWVAPAVIVAKEQLLTTK